MQPAADAGCCRGSESMAAQTEPFKAECSAVMLSGCSWLRKQADAMQATGCECRLVRWLSESMAAQMEPFRAECSAVMLSSMQLAANAGLLQRKQPAADAGCCRARASEALQR